MHTIRSFVAIPLSAQVGKTARNLIRDLSREKDGIKWVPTDNLHLTLKFLGEVIDREVPAVCQALRRVCRDQQPFTLEFSGTGGFPTSDRPRVLWAGITQGAEELTELVSALETELADLGFKPGKESLDVRLFKEEEIPWDDLAFPVIECTLRNYFRDRPLGLFGFHIEDIVRRMGLPSAEGD